MSLEAVSGVINLIVVLWELKIAFWGGMVEMRCETNVTMIYPEKAININIKGVYFV